MNDDARRALEEAGRRPVPEPRPEFMRALEQRLLAVAQTPPAPDAPPAPRRRWPQIRLVVGLTGVAAALVLVLVLGGTGVRTTPSLELTGAVNVEVALVDGTTLVDPDALLLAEGSVVRVGAGGSARIGDVVLRAGDVATVEGGRLRIQQPGSVASGPGGSAAPSADVAGSAPPPTRPPAPTPTAPPATPATTPAASPTGGAVSSAKPTTRPDGSPSPTPTSPPTVATPTAAPGAQTPKPSVDIAPLKLGARVVGPFEIGVRWSGRPRARTYVLIASISKPARRRIRPTLAHGSSASSRVRPRPGWCFGSAVTSSRCGCWWSRCARTAPS